MPTNQRLMRPRQSGRKPAGPSITVTTQGADAVAEQFTVSGGVDETVQFSNGAHSGEVTFDSMGNTTGSSISLGWSQQGSTGSPSMSFLADVAEVKPDMAKTSGGGGDVAVDIQGVDGVTEVVSIDFDGATGGTVKISDSEPIAWNADATAVESALESVLGVGVSVTGSDGVFEVTFDDPGEQSDLTVTENLLTK